MKNLLELRKNIKKKKPHFLRQNAGKLSKLKLAWRQPKGMHSKMRKKLRSYKKHPSPSYSSPKKVRGLTPEGFIPIIINNTPELKDQKAIIISGKVGLRKKIDIIKKALQLKIKILNLKNPEDFIKEIETKLKSKKEEENKKIEKRKKSKQEAIKKTEPKTKEETPEEKEKREKEEKRKILEQK